MIDKNIPVTWIDLQNQVSRILAECGMDTITPKVIETVRGNAEVDVFAKDITVNPSLEIICECKYWKNPVPKTVIHSFRSVVSDYGANWGFIISSNGYQSGAYEAMKNTNIKLLDWLSFQGIFEDRWYNQYFKRQLRAIAEPLVDYTEPMNTRVFKKADLLNQSAQQEFVDLRGKYADIAFFALSLYAPWHSGKVIDLPLKTGEMQKGQISLPAEISESESLRDLLNNLSFFIEHGLEEFDTIFGGRA